MQSVCTYGAVEDHEAVVEVVVLHGGVAVELGQWVITPGHTREVRKTQGGCSNVCPHTCI